MATNAYAKSYLELLILFIRFVTAFFETLFVLVAAHSSTPLLENVCAFNKIKIWIVIDQFQINNVFRI